MWIFFLRMEGESDRIGRDCELEISKILLMVDPKGKEGGGGGGGVGGIALSRV